MHLGCGSIYGEEFVIRVENKAVKGREVIDNRKRFKGKGDPERYVITEAMRQFRQWTKVDVDKHIDTLRVPAGENRDDGK